MLAANIRFLSTESSLRTLLVTSPAPTEGKSIVAANLAVAMAMDGLRVVLVDADLRLSQIHEIFQLRRANGLAECLRKGSVDGNLQSTKVDMIRILTSGVLPADPTSLVSSVNLKKLLANLEQEADIVIINSPPVLAVADATIIARVTDAVLLVLRADQTRSQAAEQAAEALRRANTHLVGAVLNHVPVSRSGYYSYYSHGQGEHSEKLSSHHLPFGKMPWRRRSGESM